MASEQSNTPQETAVVETGAQACLDAGYSFDLSVQLFQRDYMLAALIKHNGNLGDVAKSLGTCRATVSNYLRCFGVDINEFRMNLRPPEAREKHARRAINTRRYKRKERGLDPDAPKRKLKAVKRQTALRVPRPNKPLPAPPPYLKPWERVRVDDLGWAEEAA